MPKLSFFVFLLATIALVVLCSLSQPMGSKMPALGSFFSPFTGFWQNAEAIKQVEHLDLQMPDLQGPVSVRFDERLVPHIQAENLVDAMMAQGYVTASLRLWQMDMSTRATGGRLAEILGEDLLERDRLQRRKGILVTADRLWKRWQDKTEEKACIEAYTKGVNLYIQSLSPKDYPLEYKLMGFQPELWSPEKCMLFLLSMAESLCSRNYDIPATNALKYFGEERFRFLYPEYNPKQSPIIPTSVQWNFDTLSLEREPVFPVEALSEYISTPTLPNPPEGIGSNNWALSGQKTASGYPILCNDPHLGLNLPSIWFEIQIITPDLNAYGVSLPGLPGIAIGFNEYIAWGETNVGQDVLDWYKINWTDDTKQLYWLDGQAVEVESIVEKIQVKGKKQPVLDTVKYTQWGPIVYEEASSDYQDMAMKWMVHQAPGNRPFYELGAFLRLMKARNYDDYSTALKGYGLPPQNFVFAAKDGDIAIKVNGDFPLKRQEQGRFVQEGNSSANDWQGFIPKEQVPQVRNPERGFVASANQHSTDTSYPYYYNGGFDDYRGRYINQRLEAMQSATVEDMMALQNDSYSLKAEDALPLLLGILDASVAEHKGHPAVQNLRTWDKRFEGWSTAPVLFEQWYKEAYRLTFDEILENEINLLHPEDWRFIDMLAQTPSDELFDIKTTEQKEQAADVVLLALDTVLKQLDTSQTWSELQQFSVQHLARIPGLSHLHLPLNGYGEAPNANKPGHGPSWRMIVAFGEKNTAYGIYPGGQSGHPGSPFYDNMIDKWAAGEYDPLQFWTSSDFETAKGIQTLSLHP
ncbi:MAG TPA: penicillin acylase family protein [Saprospiraceae bacterium]|nr:penicillin acylase family protein [Saprospiraceae bacterium]HMQ84325.1 penicillin acylase family protein [Saprospiraceae bacterium]